MSSKILQKDGCLASTSLRLASADGSSESLSAAAAATATAAAGLFLPANPEGSTTRRQARYPEIRTLLGLCRMGMGNARAPLELEEEAMPEFHPNQQQQVQGRRRIGDAIRNNNNEVLSNGRRTATGGNCDLSLMTLIT